MEIWRFANYRHLSNDHFSSPLKTRLSCSLLSIYFIHRHDFASLCIIHLNINVIWQLLCCLKTINPIPPGAVRIKGLPSNRFYANDDVSHLHKVPSVIQEKFECSLEVQTKLPLKKWLASETHLTRSARQIIHFHLPLTRKMSLSIMKYVCKLSAWLPGDDVTMCFFSGFEVKWITETLSMIKTECLRQVFRLGLCFYSFGYCLYWL